MWKEPPLSDLEIQRREERREQERRERRAQAEPKPPQRAMVQS